jgi:hypothetical protein
MLCLISDENSDPVLVGFMVSVIVMVAEKAVLQILPL